MSTERLGRLLIGDASVDVCRLDAHALEQAAQTHGVLQLLLEALARRRDAASLVASLHTPARQLAAADLVREHALRAVLDAWAQEGLVAILVKGSALAYDLYASPEQRPRLDTDVLIRAEDRARFDASLTALGYDRQHEASAGLVMSQATYVSRAKGQPLHAIDVHWRISNPQVFAEVATYDELLASSVPLPRLAPAALAPAPVWSLLLACVHRVAHHLDQDRLIWLYDIRLLADRLTRDDWDQFVALARARGVAAVSARSLTRAVELLDASVPALAMTALTTFTDAEATALYLEPQSRVQRAAADMRALPSWRGRWQLMHDYVFPPPAYMRGVYAPDSRAPLAVLYARRALAGARRWIKRG